MKLKRSNDRNAKIIAIRAIAGGILAVVALSLAVPYSHVGTAAADLDAVTHAWFPVSNPLLGPDITMVRQNIFTLLHEAFWSVTVADHGIKRDAPLMGLYDFITRGQIRTVGDVLALYDVPLTARQARLVAPCRILNGPGGTDTITVQADPWQYGIASWYGPGFQGQLAASGETYNMYDQTAAHKTLPLGSIVRVVAQHTGNATVVRINDRGPYVAGRIIDLSYGAKESLGAGDITAVYLERIDPSALNKPCP